MPWTFQQIAETWLGAPAAAIGFTEDELVATFDAVERLFGRAWLDDRRARGSWGAMPTLGIARLGAWLIRFERAPGFATVLEKLRAGDGSAYAEIHAADLLCRAETEIEFGPRVQVGTRERRPDFRVREGDPAWTYVEVSHPSRSTAAVALQRVLQLVSGLVRDQDGSFALEVSFVREPDDTELDLLTEAIPAFIRAGGETRRELPGLARLALNASAPGIVVAGGGDDPEDRRERLGAAAAVVTPSGTKHISVRIPHTDLRAETFLNAEAQQVPTDAPGLVMLDLGNAIGTWSVSGELIERRLQPAQHTRIGAVCMYFTGTLMNDAGVVTHDTTAHTVFNRYARLALPEWLRARLEALETRPRVPAAPAASRDDADDGA